MASEDDSGNHHLNNERQSVASCGVRPFRVPPNFIDKNTTIDAEFARKNYHFHQFFDPTKIQQLRHNLQHCQPQSTNGSDDDIYRIIKIYQDVVSTIKQNCRMHLHSMICQRCKDINWLLEGGQEPRSMADVWRILRTKQYMIHDDGGVQYFSYTYYIIRSLSYTMNNSWVHKGVEDAVSNYYIELEEPQDRHIRHGFVKIGNLVIDALKKKLHDFELGLFQCTFLERKHNASDKQYLDRYHWIDIELDPLIVQYPKPIKGYIKSIHPPSPNIMVSFHVSQLITAVRQTNVTKSELLKMVEEKFDGNNYLLF
jgi:hypothetical protein